VTCFLRGGTIVSMPAFDPMTVWQLIREERVSLGGAVPAILNFMRQVPDFETFESPDLRCFITGAAPMPKALIELYDQKNLQVIQGYALTETGGGGSFLLSEYALSKIGSAGTAAMFAELAVRDEKGNIAESGTGEVVIRAPFLMKEYWNRPDATEEAFVDGWFRTGDVADIDEEGFVFIKDRIKDMIISGGENIYPAEIENVIDSLPAVSHCAVIGVPDPQWGEAAVALVQLRAGQSLDEDAVLERCRGQLAGFKVPRQVRFVDRLPLGPAGKVLKKVLRREYLGEKP